MEPKVTVRDSVADYYHHDAMHFIQRYESLRPEDFNKAGRVKNFVDVIMAAECALKAHIFRGPSVAGPLELYREVRGLGHAIAGLANRADFLEDRRAYEAIKARLSGLSVFLRYSLDMWELYFPLVEQEGRGGPEQYDATVGSSRWRAEAVDEVKVLIRALDRGARVVEMDIGEILEHGAEMAEFVRQARVGR
ncbi:hypothetical protein QLQ15_11115 [Lysobacter sp. LF1]|uniref:Uncharacterized protein n=1 Tax=Lysobacter stagni TaxID=3045172 RepID=A0ABT6XHA1_9GAMM|nr:hypothetical protein [Lysobacter sp. LF1]MDI9239453.1 hypothetical protein [Lysobacter sp. LF1]